MNKRVREIARRMKAAAAAGEVLVKPGYETAGDRLSYLPAFTTRAEHRAFMQWRREVSRSTKAAT